MLAHGPVEVLMVVEGKMSKKRSELLRPKYRIYIVIYESDGCSMLIKSKSCSRSQHLLVSSEQWLTAYMPDDAG